MPLPLARLKEEDTFQESTGDEEVEMRDDEDSKSDPRLETSSFFGTNLEHRN
jgi:hypothetical protein